MGGGEVKTKATSNTRYNSVTNQKTEGGVVSVNGKYTTDDNLSVYSAVDGGYSLRLDRDSYSFMLGTAIVGLKKKIFDMAAGLFSGKSIWNDDRVLGGRFQLGNPRLNLEGYGGRKVMEIWENGVARQHWHNWIWGATLAGGPSFLQARLNYEQEVDTAADISDHSISYLLNFSPGWDRLRIFSGGKFLLPKEGYDVSAGLHIDAVKNILGIEFSYVQSDLPPFFEEIEGMPDYKDKRGRLALTYSPLYWLNLTASGEAGERFFAGKAGINTPYAGAYFLYRKDRDLDTQGFGGTLYARIPATENLFIEPFATILHEDGQDISQFAKGALVNTGGRITWAILKWLAISAAGGYIKAPLTGDGGYATVNIVAGAAASRGLSSDRPKRLSNPFPSDGPVKFTPAVVPRFFGKLMNKIASKLSHLYHMSDSDIKDSNDDKYFTCGDCHTSDQIISVKKDKLDNACSNCHGDDLKKKLNKFAAVKHPGDITGLSCTPCHSGIEKLEKPTGGFGQIVGYPHANEVKDPNTGVWDHKYRQDSTCNICHDDKTQYQNHTVPTCNTCHDSIKVKPNISQKTHPKGWSVGHVWEAKKGVESCTSCHTTLSSCRSCHGEKGVMPKNIHHSIDFMKISNGKMKHGKISNSRQCAVCHTPQEFLKKENKKSKCGQCH